MMRRVEANDPGVICMLAYHYEYGEGGLQQDYAKAKEIYTRAADLGCSMAHINLAIFYRKGGDMKKAKFHYEAAAMLGNELARYNLGCIEFESGTVERAVKHWAIAASGGEYLAMNKLRICFGKGDVS
jgi:TPR repeat protein